MIFDNITETVKNTPLVKLNKINDKNNYYAKIESFNPCSSIKDRVAVNIIEQAEKKGKINKNTVIVEPTSGNTGIGLAFVCAQRGYRLILTMPESMSIERRKVLGFLGAEVILTAAKNGMKGAIEKAFEIFDKEKDSFMPGQFINPDNPLTHYKNTAKEIYNDLSKKVHIFVSGVGTGGSFSGISTFLKEQDNNIKCFAVEPKNSAVLSGEKSGPHKIQGIGAGFIPEVMKTENIDKILKISDEEAFKYMKKLACKEGILAGISSGAAYCALHKISENYEGLNIVTIFPDSGDRYLSVI